MSKFDDMKAGKIAYSRSNMNDVITELEEGSGSGSGYTVISAVDMATGWYNNTLADGEYVVMGLKPFSLSTIAVDGEPLDESLEIYLENLAGEGFFDNSANSIYHIYTVDSMKCIYDANPNETEAVLKPWNVNL